MKAVAPLHLGIRCLVSDMEPTQETLEEPCDLALEKLVGHEGCDELLPAFAFGRSFLFQTLHLHRQVGA